MKLKSSTKLYIMKPLTQNKIKVALSCVVLFICSCISYGQDKEDKTLSPYFLVKSEDTKVDQLPLRSTSVDVNIAGVIADVTIKQVYKNNGVTPIEAIYVFPASSNAAVYGMKMTIGSRVIVAEIREKQQARKEYEQAKAEGKRASLLEQDRPNVFTMNVANIMPGDMIEVALQYTELLVPTEGEYEFVFPTVVGPRFSDQVAKNASEKDQFVSTPYLKKNAIPMNTFNINVHLNTGIPIQNVKCTSHKTRVSYIGLAQANVALLREERNSGNKDYILKYSLQGEEVESGLLLYEGEKENFFLMMVEPPKNIKPSQVPDREYIFIIDVSGSMRGFPVEVSKKLMRDLITNLSPNDKFNVMVFAGTSGLLSEESLPATEENMEKAVSFIDNQNGSGSTQLLPALQKSLVLPRAEGLSRTVVIVTDGYVNVEKEAFDLIRENLNAANMFTFGMGTSVNRFLLEGMAHVGGGEPLIVTEETEAYTQAKKFRKYVNFPVLTQIDVDFKGFDAYDVEPLSVPDVLAERPVVIFGKYRGESKGEIILKGFAGKKRYKKVFQVSNAIASTKNGALKYLWARKRIKTLEDYNNLQQDDERIKEVTELGLNYNLLTPYTSFIAIDKVVANNGEITTVKQPLPMPVKVENTSIGFDLSIKGITRKIVDSKASKEYNSSLEIIDDQIAAIEDLIIEHATKSTTSGSITFKLIFDKHGNIKEVEFVNNSVDPSLEKIIRKEVLSWKFNVPNRRGKFTYESTLNFTL